MWSHSGGLQLRQGAGERCRMARGPGPQLPSIRAHTHTTEGIRAKLRTAHCGRGCDQRPLELDTCSTLSQLLDRQR